MDDLRKWYRVELDKSGAILKCEEVERAGKDGRCIRYVEALSSAEACSYAKAWHERRKARTRKNSVIREAERLKKGLCVRCGKEPKRPNSTYGDACTERQQQNQRERRHGRPPMFNRSITPEQAVENKRRSGREYNKKYGGPKRTYFQICLRRFDELGPEAFRAWLVAEIERIKARG